VKGKRYRVDGEFRSARFPNLRRYETKEKGDKSQGAKGTPTHPEKTK